MQQLFLCYSLRFHGVRLPFLCLSLRVQGADSLNLFCSLPFPAVHTVRTRCKHLRSFSAGRSLTKRCCDRRVLGRGRGIDGLGECALPHDPNGFFVQTEEARGQGAVRCQRPQAAHVDLELRGGLVQARKTRSHARRSGGCWRRRSGPTCTSCRASCRCSRRGRRKGTAYM